METQQFLGFKKAFEQAVKSKDQSTRVGCVIIHSSGKTLGEGYNSISPKLDTIYYAANSVESKKQKYSRIIHAEMRALFAALPLTTAKEPLSECVMYITHPPCCECAKHIIGSGISKVFFVKENDVNFFKRWNNSTSKAIELFNEAGVEFNSFSLAEVIGFPNVTRSQSQIAARFCLTGSSCNPSRKWENIDRNS